MALARKLRVHKSQLLGHGAQLKADVFHPMGKLRDATHYFLSLHGSKAKGEVTFIVLDLFKPLKRDLKPWRCCFSLRAGSAQSTADMFYPRWEEALQGNLKTLGRKLGALDVEHQHF